MIYFISGHCDLTLEEFNNIYIPKINKVIKEDPKPSFIMGDCEGVDKYAMDYIYNNLSVPFTICYLSEGMYNVPKGSVKLNDEVLDDPKDINITFLGGFSSHWERDAYMTQNSDFDIAYIKDNRWNSGTAQNIRRRYDMD